MASRSFRGKTRVKISSDIYFLLGPSSMLRSCTHPTNENFFSRGNVYSTCNLSEKFRSVCVCAEFSASISKSFRAQKSRVFRSFLDRLRKRVRAVSRRRVKSQGLVVVMEPALPLVEVAMLGVASEGSKKEV